MSFAMQSFLCVRDALAKAERGVPDEVTQALQSRSFPPIAEATEVVRPSSAPCDGQTFVLRFASAPAAHLAPVGPGGDPTHAVLQIIGPEIGASPLFSPTAPASATRMRRAIGAVAAAGLPAPKIWLSGELARRGALRRLPFVLLEKVEPPPRPHPGAALCALPADNPGLSSGLPTYEDAFALLAELRRIVIGAGATELDAPLARTRSRGTH